MGLVIQGSERIGEHVPLGTHVAVLAQVYDLGIRNHPRFGPRHELCLWWETAARDTKGGQFGVRDVVGANLSPKGYLRKRVEALLGRALTQDEAKSFDLGNVMGRCALVTLVAPEKDPTGYPFVNGAVPMPAGMPGIRVEGDYTKAPPFVNMVLEQAAKAAQGQPATNGQAHQQTLPMGSTSGLPTGWAQFTDPASGRTFYRRPDGITQWEPPATAAAAPPPAPPAPAPAPAPAPSARPAALPQVPATPGAPAAARPVPAPVAPTAPAAPAAPAAPGGTRDANPPPF